MEEYLNIISAWFVKGSLRQFQTAITHRLATDGYTVERVFCFTGFMSRGDSWALERRSLRIR